MALLSSYAAQRLPPKYQSMGGSPTLDQAFHWTIPQIQDFLLAVIDNATLYCDANPGWADPVNLATAAHDIHEAFRIEGKATLSSSVLYPNDLGDKRLSFKYGAGPSEKPVEIQSRTIYDTVGYVLSAVAVPPAGTFSPSVPTFYLPLIMIYAKWCSLLAESAKDDGGTFNYHLTFFPSLSDHTTARVLVGVTIGSNSKVREAVINARRKDLTDAGFKEPPGKPRNFGSCGESTFFIYAKKANIKPNSANGFALMLMGVKSTQLRTYDQTFAVDHLVNPCQQSCQDLFTQLGWSGNYTFRIGKYLGQTTTAPAAGAGGGAGPGGSGVGGPAAPASVQHVLGRTAGSLLAPLASTLVGGKGTTSGLPL